MGWSHFGIVLEFRPVHARITRKLTLDTIAVTTVTSAPNSAPSTNVSRVRDQA
jgi:hypothetical protein